MIPLSLGLKFAGVKFTAGLIFVKPPVNRVMWQARGMWFVSFVFLQASKRSLKI